VQKSEKTWNDLQSIDTFQTDQLVFNNRNILILLFHIVQKAYLSNDYRIFRTIRRTWNSLIFSKIESAPYNAVRLMYESGCAFSSRANCMW